MKFTLQNSDSNNEETGNTAVGYASGLNNVTGQNNTWVGKYAGYGGTGSNTGNVGLGSNAMLAVTTEGSGWCTRHLLGVQFIRPVVALA